MDKEGGKTIIQILTKLYNRYLLKSELPKRWDHTVVVLIYKKREPDEQKNYQPY